MIVPLEAYAVWASTWDDDAGALIDLETVWMSRWLDDIADRRVVDAGCGTGRWLVELRKRGAAAIGFDFSAAMLARAAAKDCAVALADLRQLPLPDRCADIVICALSIGHVPDARDGIAELARLVRPGGRLLLSDFHPDAHHRGWRRTFRQSGRTHEVLHYPHSISELVSAAADYGLVIEELLEPGFEERQEDLFRRAGKLKLFAEVKGLPALLLARWRRPCD